ncbi:MAG: ABC transporter permease subunit, partial [bacterium]
TARVDSGQPNGGILLELDAVAAIVIGGSSLLGGRGSVVGTLWGVLFISTLQDGLDLEGVQDDLKAVIIGTVFILAASADFFRRQLRQRELRRVGRQVDQQGATNNTGPPTGDRPQGRQLPTPSGAEPED